jgi:hypothetical protein
LASTGRSASRGTRIKQTAVRGLLDLGCGTAARPFIEATEID